MIRIRLSEPDAQLLEDEYRRCKTPSTATASKSSAWPPGAGPTTDRR